ncbi:unnamed protein product, partial [Nesidiocoris tenuis]
MVAEEGARRRRSTKTAILKKSEFTTSPAKSNFSDFTKTDQSNADSDPVTIFDQLSRILKKFAKKNPTSSGNISTSLPHRCSIVVTGLKNMYRRSGTRWEETSRDRRREGFGQKKGASESDRENSPVHTCKENGRCGSTDRGDAVERRKAQPIFHILGQTGVKNDDSQTFQKEENLATNAENTVPDRFDRVIYKNCHSSLNFKPFFKFIELVSSPRLFNPNPNYSQ